MASVFDLEQYRAGGGSGAALSVSEITYHLQSLVREDLLLQDVWVRGEVSNVTRAGSGHVYFSLKDAGACVSCVMWRSAAGRLPFRVDTGMQLLAHGSLDIYPPRGQYQLVVDQLQPDGDGALYLALEQTKARLLAEGVFDAERKRALPLFPRTVAVVTSLSGAAIRDICVILRQSPAPPAILLVPTLVQGAGAEEHLRPDHRAAAEPPEVDLVIVGRGGGSVEDLWSFNSELVVHAIAACPRPVISAVGHETDFTLADLTADLRAPTPTAAAELVVSRRSEFLERWARSMQQVEALFRGRLATARLRWQAVNSRRVLTHPEWMIERRRQDLDELEARLLRARDGLLQRSHHRLALAAGKLDAVNPLRTLARGFASVTRAEDGSPVLHAAAVEPEDVVRVRLTDGTVLARVERVELERVEVTDD